MDDFAIFYKVVPCLCLTNCSHAGNQETSKMNEFQVLKLKQIEVLLSWKMLVQQLKKGLEQYGGTSDTVVGDCTVAGAAMAEVLDDVLVES